MGMMSSSAASVVVVVILAVLLLVSGVCDGWQNQVQTPCFFIFGDSLVDNGNNNGMITLARANYMPYGVDFPQGATGRFTNGLTFVDALAVLLGFSDYIPPYSRIRGPAVMYGVNFASGASGIREETGNNLGAHVSMNEQVNNFARVVSEIRRYMRGDNNTVQDYLKKCIIYSGLGSNDYLNNYFMPNYYSTSSQFSPRRFAASVLHDYNIQLRALYELGARKVIVTGIGTIGCIPYQLARYNGTGKSGKCNEDINNVINLFNIGLRKMVDGFNGGKLPGSKFVFLDSFQSSKDLLITAPRYGFKVMDKGCCGVGRNNGQITCLPFQNPCENRNEFLFWDAFHPTEAVNILLAKKAYSSKTKSYAYPINIQELARL